MRAVKIEWEVEMERLMNQVKMTGYIDEMSIAERILLEEAMNYVTIANKSKGIIIPPTNTPKAQKGKVIIYFEIIFKNRNDFEAFLREIKERFS